MSPGVSKSPAAPCCPHRAGRRLLPEDTLRAEAHRGQAVGTRWGPARRETLASGRAVAGEPHRECCGCSFPAVEVVPFGRRRPGAAETGSVETLQGRGAA